MCVLCVCTQNLPPPHNGPVVVSVFPGIACPYVHVCAHTHIIILALLCVHIYSARREHMGLRNVRPLELTVKAATPLTPSPKGPPQTQEALEPWEGRGNLGAQVSPKALLSLLQFFEEEVLEVDCLFTPPTPFVPPPTQTLKVLR